MSDVIIKPVDQSTWPDFEAFFLSKSKLRTCWCMAWRMTSEERKQDAPAYRRQYIRQRVEAGVPIGLLAYADGAPVAWCSVAPRETYRRLGGDETLDKVWSIACFYIRREFREQGLTYQLIDAAKDYAQLNGGHWLEAYPVLPESPSYRFMGTVNTFLKAGFRYAKMAGTRRHVVVMELIAP